MTLHDYSVRIMDLRDEAIRTQRIINRLEDILILAPEKFTPEMSVLLADYKTDLATILDEKARTEKVRALILIKGV